MRFETEDWWMVWIGAAFVGLIVLIVWASIENARKWDAFKSKYNCKVVAHINGDVFNTFGTDAKGNMTVGVGSTPGKTGWLCDDGITYYR